MNHDKINSSELMNKTIVGVLLALVVVVISHCCDMTHDETMKRIETKCEAIK